MLAIAFDSRIGLSTQLQPIGKVVDRHESRGHAGEHIDIGSIVGGAERGELIWSSWVTRAQDLAEPKLQRQSCVGGWRSAARPTLSRWGPRYLRIRCLCLIDGGHDGAGRRTVKHGLANVAIDDLPAAGSQYEGGWNRDRVTGHLDAKLADDPQLRIAGQRKRQLQPLR